MNRVHFTVRDGEEERALPVWLPTEDPAEGAAWLKVDLEAEAGAETAAKLRGEALGAGEKGFAALGAALRSVREKHPDLVIHAEVAPARDVPYGDVLRAGGRAPGDRRPGGPLPGPVGRRAEDTGRGVATPRPRRVGTGV